MLATLRLVGRSPGRSRATSVIHCIERLEAWRHRRLRRDRAMVTLQRLLLLLLQVIDLVLQRHEHFIFLDEGSAICCAFSLSLLLGLSFEAHETLLGTARNGNTTLVVVQAARAFIHV